MNRVVVTDSVASMPEELVDEYDIHGGELYITQFTSVMQIIAGPDILGVAFYRGE